MEEWLVCCLLLVRVQFGALLARCFASASPMGPLWSWLSGLSLVHCNTDLSGNIQALASCQCWKSCKVAELLNEFVLFK